jgi:hypothetical protein
VGQPTKKALVDSGGEHDAELGAPRFSWGVTPWDAWVHGVGIAGGLACLGGMGLLLATSMSGLALGLLLSGAIASTLAQAYRPNRGDSFEVFENGLSDGARTLLWDQLAAATFEATDEVTRIGGVETDRVTTYRAQLVGHDGTRFVLEGTGVEAAQHFAWLRRAASHVLPEGEVPPLLPEG